MGLRFPQAVVLLFLPTAVVLRYSWSPQNPSSVAVLGKDAATGASLPSSGSSGPDPEAEAEPLLSEPEAVENEAASQREAPVAPEGRRLSFQIHSSDREHDTFGVGLHTDPILRNASTNLLDPSRRARLTSAEQRDTLLHRGLATFRQVLNRRTAAVLRKRLQALEEDLSKLPQDDMRWCHRYCKNMFFFAPALRAVAHAIGSAFLEHLGTEQLFLMNDEISYNVHGEPHFDGWHLDTNAWHSLPADAWGWTIYVPLDEGSKFAGGGWLRFRDKQNPKHEWDEEFKRGDILVFDRWIWHRLHDFTRNRPPRLAYLLRVTNDTRSLNLPLSPKYHEPLAKKLPFPVGWQINYYCRPATDAACRPRMGGFYSPDRDEVRSYHFEVDADSAVNATLQYQLTSKATGPSGLERLYASMNHMGRPTLFEYMPDQRCEEEATAHTDRGSEGRQSQCFDIWGQLSREAEEAGALASSLRGSSAAGSAAARCRNVVVELPPVMPRCVRWLHCAREDDVVSSQLYDNRASGGFPDCLLLLPMMLWLAHANGASIDSLNGLIALDVGANIGSCSLLMLAAGFHVAAFEPVEGNRQHLAKSVAQNPALARHKLALLPFGLARESRSALVVSQAGNAGNSHVTDNMGADADHSSLSDSPGEVMLRGNEVALRRLDDILSLPTSCTEGGAGAIAIMKVDVQGFEPEVFSGAENLLRRGVVGAIMFECEGERLAQHSRTGPLALYQLLRDSGFVLLSQEGLLMSSLNPVQAEAKCAGHGFNLIALHSAVYSEQAQLAIALCLRSFRLVEGDFDFSALSVGGTCRELFDSARSGIVQ